MPPLPPCTSKSVVLPIKCPANVRLRLSSESWLAKLECAKYVFDHLLKEIVLPVFKSQGGRGLGTAELHRTSQRVAPLAPYFLVKVIRARARLIFREFRRFFLQTSRRRAIWSDLGAISILQELFLKSPELLLNSQSYFQNSRTISKHFPLNFHSPPRPFSRVGPLEGIGLNKRELRAGGLELVLCAHCGWLGCNKGLQPMLKNDIAKGNVHSHSLSSLETSLAAHLTCPQKWKAAIYKTRPLVCCSFLCSSWVFRSWQVAGRVMEWSAPVFVY